MMVISRIHTRPGVDIRIVFHEIPLSNHPYRSLRVPEGGVGQVKTAVDYGYHYTAAIVTRFVQLMESQLAHLDF